MDEVEVAVAGAGVIGLAVARALALQGRDVLLLESARAIGTATSSRNSEVVHAGLYYPPGSLKARFCVEGRPRLYAYCEAHGVANRRCGKLIVAADEAQRPALTVIAGTAAANGVDDILALDRRAVQAAEPAVSAVMGLLSPSTGVFDTHGYMQSLLGDAQDRGAVVAYGAELTRVRPTARGLELSFGDDAAPQVAARVLVNAAGLQAPALAARVEGLPPRFHPPARFAKGSYFILQGRSPFRHLVYPVPEPGGLGVHATLDLGGQVRFGPDVEWVDEVDYTVDPARGMRFYQAVRRYWPGLPDGALQPGYAGVRPKLTGPGEPAADFRIDGPAEHGVAGLINLFGIESPGLTASLPLADHVAALAGERLDA